MSTSSYSLMLTPGLVEITFQLEPTKQDGLLKKPCKTAIIFMTCAVAMPIFCLLSAILQTAALVFKSPFFIISFIYRPFTEVSDELTCKEMLTHIKRIACLFTAIILTPTVFISMDLYKSLCVGLELGSPERHRKFTENLEKAMAFNKNAPAVTVTPPSGVVDAEESEPGSTTENGDEGIPPPPVQTPAKFTKTSVAAPVLNAPKKPPAAPRLPPIAEENSTEGKDSKPSSEELTKKAGEFFGVKLKHVAR